MRRQSVTLRNTDEFEHVARKLGLVPGNDEYAVAHAFWEALRDAAPDTSTSEACTTRRAVAREEAVVWRILLTRMLGELANVALFRERNAGAAQGTVALHPGLDALAKTYERLRRIMSDVTNHPESAEDARRQGLPDVMKPILEETEVVFDELLGPGGFPGRAPKHRNGRGADSSK